MFQVKVVFVLLTIIVTNIQSASVRLFFSNCAANGFTCTTEGGVYHITYTCPPKTEDVTFYLWNFRPPTNTIDVKLQRCDTLRLSMECSGGNFPIRNLLITNITNLIIIPSVLTHNPPTIQIENIANLEYLPTNTFSQIKLQTYKPGCFNPVNDLQNLILKNVSIGTIATKAFNNLRGFNNFTWFQVDVKRLQYAAINMEMDMTGDFHIEQSNIGICEHLAFQITGKRSIFVDNKFVELSTSSINGTIESFKFITNKVITLQSSAISILTKDVSISNNNFEYLHAGALQNISPGLLQDSQRNFGTLRFFYEFSLNHLRFIEAGSLNPDIVAYNNVATDLKFTRNLFLCTCENFGWLFIDVGHGFKTKVLKQFYTTIIDKQYKNSCSQTTCELPVNQIEQLIDNGGCLPNITAEDLCAEKKPTSWPPHKTTISWTTKPDRAVGRFLVKTRVKISGGAKLTNFSLHLFNLCCIVKLLSLF